MTNAFIIGTGNIAFHFFPVLNNIQGLSISSILARSEEGARAVRRDSNVKIISNYSDIPVDSEVVFLMVNDDSVLQVSKKLRDYLSSSCLLIHFSGSLGLSAIDNYYTRKGIIWPIQSISKADRNLDLSETPISISYSDDLTKKSLVQWVSKISKHIYFLTEEEKKFVHLSAVFANNFTNHMYLLASEILGKENLSFELIKPLIQKTAQKALLNHPLNNQTGPAIRNDQEIMSKHLEMLSDSEQKEIYKIISSSILKNQ